MPKESTGCFAWIVSFKQSCDERWARFRNRLRRRFYARRGQRIDPSTIVNETGTRDMVISKSPYKTNKVLPENLVAPKTTVTEYSVAVGSVAATGLDDVFEKLVGEYVSGIIIKAVDTLRLERWTPLSSTNVTVDNSADRVSLSSSIVSQIADIAVAESLSNILLDTNINQSAIRKTIKEFMEVFGIVGGEVCDQPTVSE
ncbi:uncharacterized protein LOC123547974 isoform X2 [Mercenaria mercenaria]|uniref:uncharacterized protein LOC123547974 isoform X2 n=1 Tax=Mercenaria mercenaria TaxID=6596 RepID=UPI00234EDF73|nr:uncharacterized protein LOC123547974 isoform X2 [Mercenaria mercenaria]